MLRKLRWVVVFLIVVGLVAAVYLSGAIARRAALSINSDPQGQKVYLSGEEVGETPYFSEQLEPGDPVIQFGDFNQKVHLTSGALSVVDWVTGPSETFSGGHVVWFSESSTGSELLVITKPVAEVFLDGESIGDSPLSRSIDPGEYELEIKKEGYFPRTVKISVRDGFRLNVSANLALRPFPESPQELSSPHNKITLSNLSTGIQALYSDLSVWVQGVVFWVTREGGASYDFFLTEDGKFYDSAGSEVAIASLPRTEESYSVGYLGQGSTLSQAGQNTLNLVISKLYPTPPKVQILETGLGFLRVRSGPGTTYSEIGKAAPGDTYTYLSEQGGWFKIDFQGREGWVSAEFSKKL
ncbi:PEGA domain-containing protein [Candidatus Saccharibacteria bacterium]|nr:PEGA domain-containing protein [Candidatus Saccharibacteria bacterium]